MLKLRAKVWFRVLFLAVLLVFSLKPNYALENKWDGKTRTYDRGRSIAMEIYNEALSETNIPNAIESLEKAKAIFPESININMALAALYLKTEKTQEGIEHLKQSLKIVPGYPTASVLLGEQLLYKKQYIEALKLLKPVYEKTPDKQNLGFYMGYAYYNLGNFKKANECFKANISDDSKIKELNEKFLKVTKELSSGYKWLIIRDSQSPLWAP